MTICAFCNEGRNGFDGRYLLLHGAVKIQAFAVWFRRHLERFSSPFLFFVFSVLLVSTPWFKFSFLWQQQDVMF